VFRGQEPMNPEATLNDGGTWQPGSIGHRERAGLLGARPLESRCQAWRETLKIIEWETGQGRAEPIEEWLRKHPVRLLPSAPA
jgi:hypothetical protein